MVCHAVGVSGSVVFVALALAAFCLFSGYELWHLPRVWRGGSLPSGLSGGGASGLTLSERSYPAFAVCTAIFSWGFAVGLAAMAAHLTVVEYAGVLVGIVGIFSMFATVPLINAFNQPWFLVPPSRRQELGTWAQRRDRRAHGPASRHHQVEILEVRAGTHEPTDEHHYFLARCTVTNCGWMAGPIGRDASHLDPVSILRKQASKHSALEATGPITITA